MKMLTDHDVLKRYLRKAAAIAFAAAVLMGMVAAGAANGVTAAKVYAENGAGTGTSFDVYEYDLTPDGAVITGCDSGASGAVTVPETLGGSPVTAIANEAFRGCRSIEEIILPESLTDIGAYAFWGCESLTDVTLSENARIGISAFRGCGGVDVRYIGCGEELVQYIPDEDSVEAALQRSYSSGRVKPAAKLAAATRAASFTITDEFIDMVWGKLLQFPADVPLSSYNIPYSYADEIDAALLKAKPLEHVAYPAERLSFYYTTRNGEQYITRIKPAYIDAGANHANEFAARLSALHTAVDPILDECEGKSDFEIAAIVHDHLVLDSRYDTTYSIYDPYTILTAGTGVCQAYSEAFRMFMLYFDIPCIILSSSGMNHAWNFVQIEGEWFHVDCTWDDPIADRPGIVRYDYFLLNDNEFPESDHYGWAPAVSSTSSRFSNMPRFDNARNYQQLINGRWYYYSAGHNSIVSSDRYGNDVRVEFDDATGCGTFYDGMIVYAAGRTIKIYNPDNREGKSVYTLTPQEGGQGYQFGWECNISNLSVSSAGILSYKYHSWNVTQTGSGYSGSQTTENGANTFDLNDPAYFLGVTFETESYDVPAGDTVALDYHTVPYNTRAALSWSSSDTGLATVSGGTVQTVAQGEAVITASSSPYSASCTVNIGAPVTVTLSSPTLDLYAGDSAELTAEVNYPDYPVTWSTSDPSVAVVDNGNVTAVAQGTAVITATANSCTAQCTVTVTDRLTAFIANMYSVCLGREATADDIAYYKWMINDNGMTGTQAASEFIFSDEFKIKNYCDRHYTIALYNAFMGREPSADEIANWTWRLQEGDTREEVFNFFATSAEFGDKCAAAGITAGTALDFGGRSTKPGGYCSVDGCEYNGGKIEFARRLYEVCLDREPDQSEVDAWHYYLVHGDHTGVSASQFFLTSPEFTGHNYDDEAYITHLYNAMMGRDPSDGELSYWVWRLTTDDPNNRATREQLIDEFAASDEFKVICQNYGVVHS